VHTKKVALVDAMFFLYTFGFLHLYLARVIRVCYYHLIVMYFVDCCSVLPVMLVTLWTSWDS